jgi:hypothetical protein
MDDYCIILHLFLDCNGQFDFLSMNSFLSFTFLNMKTLSYTVPLLISASEDFLF